jgi:ATP-dependent Clp protease ATP-binding subunit ClpX
VNLRLTDSALAAIADEALKRKSGARGLRAILESCMLDIMYDIPSKEDVKECVIGEEVVLKKEEPILLYEPSKKTGLIHFRQGFVRMRKGNRGSEQYYGQYSKIF